jgi:acyl-coenzyme A thioesterase PaaI-like protein
VTEAVTEAVTEDSAAASRHRFVSDNLGLGQFPEGTGESPPMGDHIMGVTIIGWLTQFPLARWGERWATNGSMRLRFRAHLTSGLDLIASVDPSPRSLGFTITDSNSQIFASGDATSDGTAAAPAPVVQPHPSEPAQTTPESLKDRVLTPIRFCFEADRDLQFTRSIEDSRFWTDRGWAHPAWLASATNAIVRQNVAFPPPGHWTNAGVEFHLHAPIGPGSLVTMTGVIDELFDRRRHRFAVASITASVDGEPVASLRNTFVYTTATGDSAD